MCNKCTIDLFREVKKMPLASQTRFTTRLKFNYPLKIDYLWHLNEKKYLFRCKPCQSVTLWLQVMLQAKDASIIGKLTS